MAKIDFFRKKYPKFIYRGYSYKIIGNNLKTVFDFQIGDIYFKPEINIKNVEKSRLKRMGERAINNFVFHLGLMEIPSYWKTTCSPEIVVESGYLNKEQAKWWRDLIVKGMGQFFYENQIDWRKPNFLKIKSNKTKTVPAPFSKKLKNRYLVPIGGGRDSIVTLEKLKKPTVLTRQKKEINCFLINPTKAAKKVIKIAGFKNPIVIERKIDPTLLKLNKKGHLNGHTPFTAVLSFLSVFSAVLFDYKNIAFSNEKSANEGNVRYLGWVINHQYSKSSEFESKFKNYCQKYLARNINYFSFLRKYTELEISKIFVKYPKYFSAFSSCNIAGKVGPPRRRRPASLSRKRGERVEAGDRWCGKCPKCLFVYTTLYPFLGKKQLLRIFGKDFFENKKLLSIMKGLLGRGKAKPFECVGTYKESKKAFNLSLKRAKKSGKTPYLLKKLNEYK